MANRRRVYPWFNYYRSIISCSCNFTRC
jgi:hypothetical protein